MKRRISDTADPEPLDSVAAALRARIDGVDCPQARADLKPRVGRCAEPPDARGGGFRRGPILLDQPGEDFEGASS
jgi:hypothetical protein